MPRKPETPDETVEKPESHDKPENIPPNDKRETEAKSDQDLLMPGQFIPYHIIREIIENDSGSTPEITHRFNFDTGNTLASKQSDENPASDEDDDNTSQPVSHNFIPRDTNRPPVRADLINLLEFHSRKPRKKKD